MVIIIIINIIVPDIITMFRILIKNDFNIELLSTFVGHVLFNLFLPLVLLLIIFNFYYHWEKKPGLNCLFIFCCVDLFPCSMGPSVCHVQKCLRAMKMIGHFSVIYCPKTLPYSGMVSLTPVVRRKKTCIHLFASWFRGHIPPENSL